MLEINGRKFAKNASEFAKTLFQADGTATGFYKRTANGVRLLDAQKKTRVFIVANPRQGYFAVTAHETGDGIRYMFSLTSEDERWLGFDSLKYSEQHDACKAAQP